jgi:hypothetical protein
MRYCTVLTTHSNISIEFSKISAEFHENPLRDVLVMTRRQVDSSGCISVTLSYERAVKCRISGNFYSLMRS